MIILQQNDMKISLIPHLKNWPKIAIKNWSTSVVMPEMRMTIRFFNLTGKKKKNLNMRRICVIHNDLNCRYYYLPLF